MIQQGDVKLYQTLDSGEIDIVGGIVAMDTGMATAVYLSLFGGNRDDPGESDQKKTWWGNVEEPDIDKQYRSKTQYLLQSIPVTSFNLLRIKAAAENDIDWLKKQNGVDSIDVSVTIPGLNRIKIVVLIIVNGEYYEYAFNEQWGNS